jgi:hypothetical protein
VAQVTPLGLKVFGRTAESYAGYSVEGGYGNRLQE